jgi:hypothetical protein
VTTRQAAANIKMRLMKKTIIFLTKPLLSLLFTLLLLEAGLRLFPGVIPLSLLTFFHDQPRVEIAQRRGLPVLESTVQLERDDGGPELRIFKPYTRLTYTNREVEPVVTVTRDENGFCNLEGSYQQPAIDVITLGDSFTVCHAVYPEDTWTSQLAALTGYSTYNLGRGSVGILEYLQILKTFGLQKSPRLVIMNVYEGNDLRDADRYFEYIQGKISDDDAPLPASPLKLPVVSDYSYAFNLLIALAGYVQNLLTKRKTSSQTTFKYKLSFSTGVTVPFNLEDTDKDEVRFARRLRDHAVDIGVSATLETAFQEFVTLSRQHNFVPIVTYTPSAHTAYTDYAIFDDPTLTELMPWFSQEQRRFIEEQSQTLGFTFIDLTPALQEAARANEAQRLLYDPRDLHLTVAGHTVIAQALSQQLQTVTLSER